MNRITNLTRFALAATALAFAPGLALAAPVSSAAYSLTSIDGSWAYGRTAWNGLGQFGYINNISERGAVEAMLSDGYVAMSSAQAGKNGIYRWGPSGGGAAAGLTFGFDGGIDHLLTSFSFTSSRSMSSATQVLFDYALDGGDWLNAAATTSGVLGLVYNGNAQTFALNFSEVRADAFRIRFAGGDQVSLHEIAVAGTLAKASADNNAVPEPTSAALVAVGLLGLGVASRRTRRQR